MDPIPLVLDAECPPSEIHLRQGDVKKVHHGSELDRMKDQHLHDQKKKDKKLDVLKKYQELDDSKKDQTLDDSKNDQKLDDSKNDQELDYLKKYQGIIELEDCVNYSKSLYKSFSFFMFGDSKNCCVHLLETLRRYSLRRGQMLNFAKKYLLKNEPFPEATECADSNRLPHLQALMVLKESR